MDINSLLKKQQTGLDFNWPKLSEDSLGKPIPYQPVLRKIMDLNFIGWMLMEHFPIKTTVPMVMVRISCGESLITNTNL